uniref:Uncharacterized protein n=1 Tax=Picea glauca TaxID=3330 RepID=A0A101LYT9_PICGL|nr:hypothetical protein ABT39_MTgene4855 [Picea glauca]QHR88650.1 hypothetical protein Q903MT_gene2664 [Picea sitchensis]
MLLGRLIENACLSLGRTISYACFWDDLSFRWESLISQWVAGPSSGSDNELLHSSGSDNLN